MGLAHRREMGPISDREARQREGDRRRKIEGRR